MTTKTVPGFSKYLMRSDGEVVSHHRTKPRVLTGGTDKDGYRKFVLIDDAGVRRYVRRAMLIFAAFHGPRPAGLNVRHLDGSRTNDAPINLCWGTQAENIADKWRHGTAQIGERCSRHKLTEAQVREIRANPSFPSSHFALRFGVRRETIWNVRRRRSWAWMPADGIDAHGAARSAATSANVRPSSVAFRPVFSVRNNCIM